MLPTPRLHYAHEFDPYREGAIVELVRPACGKHERKERVHRLPVVTIEFPKNLRIDAHLENGVMGLTQDQVNWIREQKIAMPWAAIPSVEFLFAEAQKLWSHPLLQRFDTAIRDSMSQVAVEAVYRAFLLLSDYLYDPKTKYWPEGDEHTTWHKLATYYYWIMSDQVGSGLPHFYAKLDEVSKWTDPAVAKVYREVRERGKIWKPPARKQAK